MQEQDKIELVWQVPELVELGSIAADTQYGPGPYGDGGIFSSNSSHS